MVEFLRVVGSYLHDPHNQPNHSYKHHDTQAETEVQNLTKKVRTLEEEFETTEDKLKATSEKLEQASKAADDSERCLRECV